VPSWPYFVIGFTIIYISHKIVGNIEQENIWKQPRGWVDLHVEVCCCLLTASLKTESGIVSTGVFIGNLVDGEITDVLDAPPPKNQQALGAPQNSLNNVPLE
jgi:hypothetical protein